MCFELCLNVVVFFFSATVAYSKRELSQAFLISFFFLMPLNFSLCSKVAALACVVSYNLSRGKCFFSDPIHINHREISVFLSLQS